jgi:hypothetical protein
METWGDGNMQQKNFEFFKTHENKNRKREYQLFMMKVKYALDKSGLMDEMLTMQPNNGNEKTMKDILEENGTFYYSVDGLTMDIEFDRCIYIFINNNF